MMYRYILKHKKEFLWICEYQNVLIFPKAAKTKFPYASGSEEVSKEKIIQNIKLQQGLNRKCMEQYLKRTKDIPF